MESCWIFVWNMRYSLPVHLDFIFHIAYILLRNILLWIIELWDNNISSIVSINIKIIYLCGVYETVFAGRIPVCKACCSFSKFSSWAMSLICFLSSSIAALFAESVEKWSKNMLNLFKSTTQSHIVLLLFCKSDSRIQQVRTLFSFPMSS